MATATGGVTLAKTVRHRKSPGKGKFVGMTSFRALESKVFQMCETMESIRHESSNNLRRCGELQFELDELKKANELLKYYEYQLAPRFVRPSPALKARHDDAACHNEGSAYDG